MYMICRVSLRVKTHDYNANYRASRGLLCYDDSGVSQKTHTINRSIHAITPLNAISPLSPIQHPLFKSIPNVYITMIHWNYTAMRSWYVKHSHYIDDTKDTPVFAIIYERKNKKSPYFVEPFVKSEIKYASLSPVQNETLFPNGFFPTVSSK
jgi:hypothetical protein